MSKIRVKQIQGLDTLTFYIPTSGNTVSKIANAIYATTISATTYQNLPLDVFLTGGTYSASSSTIIFTNNTGGTFNVSGITTTGGVSGDYLPLSGGTIDTTIGVVISGNSSSDMLRITQIGSGNAILVEDSTNPDSTPFVVDSTGNVGIGNINPSSKLYVSGDTFISDSLSANTFYGNGSGLTNIQLSSVTNLQTELNNKFDKTGGTVTGSVIITQNVTVLGTATTINTQTLSIADNVVTLNSNYSAGTPFFGHSGVEVLRGSGTTAAMLWEEQNSQWEAGLHGSTRKIILSGDSLSYLSSGHTHPISEITNLQTNLNDKLSKSTGGTVVAESYFQGGLTASTTSANQLVIPFASVAVYEDEPPSISSVGIAGFFDASTGVASSKYSLQLKDGSEGVNKVLISKTTDGKANWSDIININGITGTVITISNTPTYNNHNTQILTRNSSTGAIQYSDSSSPNIFNYGLASAISSGNYLI